ncbi:unnamed protein product [Leuciscus chuanchicus]
MADERERVQMPRIPMTIAVSVSSPFPLRDRIFHTHCQQKAPDVRGGHAAVDQVHMCAVTQECVFWRNGVGSDPPAPPRSLKQCLHMWKPETPLLRVCPPLSSTEQWLGRCSKCSSNGRALLEDCGFSPSPVSKLERWGGQAHEEAKRKLVKTHSFTPLPAD